MKIYDIDVPQTIKEFNALVVSIEAKKGYRRPIGFAIGRVDLGQKNKNKVLQISYPVVNWGNNFGSAAIFTDALRVSGVKVDSTGSEFVAFIDADFIASALEMFTPYVKEAKGNEHRNVQVLNNLSSKRILDTREIYKIVFIYEDQKVQSVEAAYLKLYAISTGQVNLRSLNLEGVFGMLENVAWVGNKPIELDWLREKEISLKLDGEYPAIDSVDKFPRFLQHIIPDDNIRILDASKVRFGAQLAAGTIVMPGASYINFNAGTLGPVMVEGRISSSAIVGAGSDVGGGASILGVLSGTDGNPISIGENTLLGANSVTGIPLGDACIIDAGVAILAGTKVKIDADQLALIIFDNPNTKICDIEGNEYIDIDLEEIKKIDNEKEYIFKAEKLQGLNGLHFRQNSISGEVLVKRSTREVKLNEDLH